MDWFGVFMLGVGSCALFVVGWQALADWLDGRDAREAQRRQKEGR